MAQARLYLSNGGNPKTESSEDAGGSNVNHPHEQGGGFNTHREKSMGNDKETSPEVAKKASDVLTDDRHSDKVHSVAASDLSQAEGNKDNKGGSESKGESKKD